MKAYHLTNLMELLFRNYLGNSLLGWILLILFMPFGMYLTIVKDSIIGVVILVVLLVLELTVAGIQYKLKNRER